MIARICRLLVAAVLTVAGLGLALVPASAAQAGSAVTVSGTGEFSALRVTVSQTADLINQTVHVSWTGGAPTGPSGNFSTNFLQIMQCWGDDPAGPRREQCQFGGLAAQGSPVAGAWVRNRQVSYGDTLHDDAETLLPEPGKQAVVPFTSVTGTTTTQTGDFFTAGTTNEIPLAKTRLDGTGEADFEVQTATESYGLGCGTVVGGTPRPCWLVVVPRGTTEVNGRIAGQDYGHTALDSSPLSASNWQNRIAVKLAFQPVGAACPMGAAERPTAGHEFVAEAVLRWQPRLCANGGTVFGYTELSDATARSVAVSDKPGLDFVSDPVPPGEVPANRRLVYAPVAVSGLSIAFLTERQSAGEGVVPDAVWQRDGEPITELNLTPRLAAKLLTQSYQLALPLRQDYLARNPDFLTRDPDFLALNPEFASSGVLMSTVDALVPTLDADATAVLWTWINADPDARAFLDGKPDPWGMTVNPNFRGLSLPVPNFPKADLSCGGTGLLRSCVLDLRPLAADMHDAGRAISRGDTLGKAPTGFATADGKPELKAVDRQPQGQRSLLAVVDTATAARYGLPTAKLRNASGAFVAPTRDALTAGVTAMKPSAVPGVLLPDPLATAAAAYPLTTVSYAVTAPSALDSAGGAAYAQFISYAAGEGQTPGVEAGRLPDGYLPLPEGLRQQARAAAKTIADQAGKPVTTGAGETGGASAGAAASGGDGGAPVNAASGQAAASASVPAAAAAPVTSAKPAETGSRRPAAASRPTPASPVGPVRYVLAGLLLAGGLGAGAGPALLRLSGRMRR
ncbi:hypothetical protein ORV05_11485 [Amycolatopsis cynarae]|uniref:PBP domain-containing protein n=1 Tax=Amycolatopsis cynarae TaxID=2995223 RepID=A0ABY7B7P4_9PSEU|nr:hypothetical protein [Amycolatopsis sp. HUAS 11-8]WAL68355.1 hypothetical protein ORV05_11485 [Amycolatopsis sp. HUAS 11-8]